MGFVILSNQLEKKFRSPVPPAPSRTTGTMGSSGKAIALTCHQCSVDMHGIVTRLTFQAVAVLEHVSLISADVIECLQFRIQLECSL
jgi:hypothetical protein